MFKVNPYPAILEKTKKGYSVFFPDLPGAVSAGKNYEHAIQTSQGMFVVASVRHDTR